jgi:cyclase
VPLAAGGGIRTIEDVRRFMALGADKVTINTQALARPEFITEIAEQYGTQSVVVSIDALRTENGDYEVLSEFATKPSGLNPVDWARKCEQLGAGEILVTSVEKDGSIEGYDLELCRMVADCVRIPVLICGGAGTWSHFEKAFVETKVSAVCTANIYHFTETSIKSAKTHLNKAAINVRY